jgi:hypothetical protein
MKFWLVLLILGWRLRWLAWRNPEFRKTIESKDMVMQWKTLSGKPARWYHFNKGRVIARGGEHEKPDVALNFESAGYAFDTLMESGKNQMVFMEGMQQGRIKIEGDPSQLMWFMGLMKFIMPKKKKK